MACAIKRLAKEYQALQNPLNRVCEVYAAPLEDNIFTWHFTIKGPNNDKLGYSDGLYHGALVFPRAYPFEPPDIIFFTPNGRFETHVKICSTISSYHPERWQPTIDVNTILIALRLFMEQENEIGSGGINGSNYSFRDKQEMARSSRSYLCKECGCSMQHIWEKEMCPYPRLSLEKEMLVTKASPQPAPDTAPVPSVEEKCETAGAALQTYEVDNSKKDTHPNEEAIFDNCWNEMNETLGGADKAVGDVERGGENSAHSVPIPSISLPEITTEVGTTYPVCEPIKVSGTLSSSFGYGSAVSPTDNAPKELSAKGRLPETRERSPLSTPISAEKNEAQPIPLLGAEVGPPLHHSLAGSSVNEHTDMSCVPKGELSRQATQTPKDSEGNTKWTNYNSNHSSKGCVKAADDSIVEEGDDDFDSECELIPAERVVAHESEVIAKIKSKMSKNASEVNAQEANQPDTPENAAVVGSPEERPCIEVDVAFWSVKLPISYLDWLMNVCVLVGGVFWLHRLCIALFRYYVGTGA